jgi:hypothetical protein
LRVVCRIVQIVCATSFLSSDDVAANIYIVLGSLWDSHSMGLWLKTLRTCLQFDKNLLWWTGAPTSIVAQSDHVINNSYSMLPYKQIVIKCCAFLFFAGMMIKGHLSKPIKALHAIVEL